MSKGCDMSNESNESNEGTGAYMSASAVAEHIGVSPKAFRRFVREYVKGKGGRVGQDTPGRGGRYAFERDSIDAIAAAYEAWSGRAGAMLITFDAADDASEGDA